MIEMLKYSGGFAVNTKCICQAMASKKACEGDIIRFWGPKIYSSVGWEPKEKCMFEEFPRIFSLSLP
jgi:hypothetical protein